MPATGYVEYEGKTYEFPEGESFGLLDWGRGVWTYKNTWYWGVAQGMVDGKRIGWNIGYGFSANHRPCVQDGCETDLL